jgi:hypothetical protein
MILHPWILFCMLNLLGLKISSAQNNKIRSFDFMVPMGTSETIREGLTVSVSQVSFKVDTVSLASTTSSSSHTICSKNVIAFQILVENSGIENLAVYGWDFTAICPKHAGSVNDSEFLAIHLSTAYISERNYLILRPGEKKILTTARTDFYQANASNPCHVPIQPTHLRAEITCNLDVSESATIQGNDNEGDEIVDPLLMNLIREYHETLTRGDFTSANIQRESILEMVKALFSYHKWLILQFINDKKYNIKNIYAKTPTDTLVIPPGLISVLPQDVDSELAKSPQDSRPNAISDPSLTELINQYRKEVGSGNSVKAQQLKNGIMAMAKQAYPERLKDLEKILAKDEPGVEKPKRAILEHSSGSGKLDAKVFSYSLDGDSFCAVEPPDTRFNGLYIYPGQEARFWKFEKGEPIVELNADQSGKFQNHGVPPVRIKWWIESDCKGKIQKIEGALGERYILVLRYEETGSPGYPPPGSFRRMALDVFKENNKIVILGERVKQNQ